jgi:hypothetical protein
VVTSAGGSFGNEASAGEPSVADVTMNVNSRRANDGTV